MNEIDMVLNNLATLGKCRRCACLSCDRDINGLHGHICTQGEHCVDTPAKMMQHLDVCAIVISQARTIIESLLRSNNQNIDPQNQIAERINDAASESPESNSPNAHSRPSADSDFQTNEQRVETIDTLNQKTIFDALAFHKIESVTIDFDGYGDNGQIESIQVNTKSEISLKQIKVEYQFTERHTAESHTTVIDLSEAIEDLVYRLLEQTHNGWEDNQGAFGEFTFDTASRKVTLAYNERFTDSHYSEHQF